MKQLDLLKKPSLQYDGSKHVQRVLCSKRPIHLCLKTKKTFSLFKSREKVKSIFQKQAKSFGIQIYSWSVQNDHIHFSLKIPIRDAYRKFIRAVTGLIARALGKGIWLKRPFSRILSGFGKDFAALNNYIFRNEMEIFKVWRYDRNSSVFELAEKTKTRIFYLS